MKINVIIILITLIAFTISGCKKENAENIEKNITSQINYNEQEADVLDVSASNNLVYREYSMGEKFHPGEVIISREKLLDTVNEPKTIVIYFNDKIIETIDYNNTDIQVNLDNEGMYCFVVIDEDNISTDVTSHVQGTSYLEDGTVYLK